MLTRLLDRLALLPDRTHANLIWCLRPALSRPRRQEPSLSSARSKGESVSLYRCLLLQASPQIPYRKPSAALPRTTAVRPSVSTAGTPTVSFVSVSVHIQTSAPSPEATRYAPHYSKPFRPQTARLGPKQPALHSHCGIVRMESCAPDTDAGTSAVVSREQPCHRFFDPVVLLASVVDLSLSTPSQVTFPKTPAASGYCPRSGTSYPDRLGSSVPTMTTSSSPRIILSCHQSFEMPLLPRPAPLLHAAREAAGE
jgi:hypothetical protein